MWTCRQNQCKIDKKYLANAAHVIGTMILRRRAKRCQHTLVNAVTAKLCGATGEKSMCVTAPNSFIWTGACKEKNRDEL